MTSDMDNHDMPLPAGALTERLDERLWPVRCGVPRSAELTPLYVNRYAGPRESKVMTAHSFWEFIYVFAGQGVLYHPGGQFRLFPGLAVLVPPRITHREENAGGLDTLWMGLRGTCLSFLSRERRRVAAVPSADLERLCDQLWQTAGLRQPGKTGPELDALCRLVLAGFMCNADEGRGGKADWLEHTLSLLQREFRQTPSIPALAKQCGCSAGHFFREFKRRTGQTPVEYLTRLRVQHAVNWLSHSTLSVKEIAYRAGFQDPFYFSRVCRKVTGKPPAAWRCPRGTIGDRP